MKVWKSINSGRTNSASEGINMESSDFGFTVIKNPEVIMKVHAFLAYMAEKLLMVELVRIKSVTPEELKTHMDEYKTISKALGIDLDAIQRDVSSGFLQTKAAEDSLPF